MTQKTRWSIALAAVALALAAFWGARSSRVAVPHARERAATPRIAGGVTLESRAVASERYLQAQAADAPQSGPAGASAAAPRTADTSDRPRIFFWGETAVSRWHASGTAELSFPGLQASAERSRLVKTWGIRRGQTPTLLSRAEIAVPSLGTRVDVTARELLLHDQVIITCSAWTDEPAAILASVQGPPPEWSGALENRTPDTCAIESWLRVDDQGDLVRETFDLPPDESWPVPDRAWALVARSR